MRRARVIDMSRPKRPSGPGRKRSVQLTSGASNPLTQTVGTLSATQVKEIAERKLPDLNANDIDAAIQIVSGTARSMGVKVNV